MFVIISIYCILSSGCATRKNIIPKSAFSGTWSLSKLITSGVRKACNVCPLINFDSLNIIVVTAGDSIIEKYQYRLKDNILFIKNLDTNSNSSRSYIFSYDKYKISYTKLKNAELIVLVKDEFNRVEIGKEILKVADE